MRVAARLAAVIERVLATACGAVLASMLALVVCVTFQRYAFGGGFLGAEEAGVWLLLVVVCLGFPLAGGGVLAMRIELFGGRVARLRFVLAEATVLAAGLALAVSGAKAASQVGGVSPLLGLGEWMRPAALAASGATAAGLCALKLAGAGRLADLCAAAALALLAVAVVSSGAAPALPVRPSLAAALIVGLGILAAAPLPHVFIVAGYGALAFGSPLVEPALALSLLSGMGRHLLLAIPFFLLAGALLVVSGLADGLIRFAAAIVGNRRGGAGQTVLATSVLFSGVSGSSIANAAFSAKTFFRPLVASGYPPEKAGAIIASTAVLDNIIPPSIAFFILASATNLPVGPLLVGGLVAGLALAAALALAIRFASPDALPGAAAPRPPILGLAARALPVFGLGLVVVFGIRLGVMTPTEAAGIAAAYTLVAALLSRGNTRAIVPAFRQAGAETATILMLVGAAAPLAFLLAVDGVAASAARLALAMGENPFAVMLAANLLLLVAGLVLDIGAAILLFGPILLPVAVAVGLDPVHFGVILVVNLMIGGLTPPVGILVQVTSAATGVSAIRLFRAVAPYLAALLATLLAMSFAVAANSRLASL